MAAPNVHISTHPCLRAKLSQLRSKHANARETKALIHEIALIVAVEALASELTSVNSGTADTPLGAQYTTETVHPPVALVPVLRSGLGMLEALQTLLPDPVPVHHLGLYREPTTLQPVEYYNNLPYHRPSSASAHPDIAILLDPIIATGGTSVAAIQTLLEWGVKKVVVIAVLASEGGLDRASKEGGAEGQVEIWVGGCDKEVTDKGMIRPGMGDVGDRLFLTIGK
ncbi:MAG: hypothetical protein L6R42_003088 [Xanthoria sp. 1 TBL-2021]|nr:MAG: hypothetical protein L6R42_003088 [Xanthoria sp. 1 TBL-2021]